MQDGGYNLGMNKNRLLQKEECVIRNSFWNRYIDLVKNMVIPYQWDILNDRREDAEPSHAIDNLRINCRWQNERAFLWTGISGQ